MKQHNEVALMSSGRLTVSANGLRLSIVTGHYRETLDKQGVLGKHGDRWKEYLKGSSVLDHWGY